MIYEELKKNISWIVQFKSATTIYDLKAMPRESVTDKVKFCIHLIKLINWLKYEWIVKGTVSKPLDLQAVKQSISSAITYHAQPKVVVWHLVKILLEYIGDLNYKAWETRYYNKFNALVWLLEQWEDVKFDDWFEGKLDEVETLILDERKNNDLVIWSKDIDWKIELFKVMTADGIIDIPDRNAFMRLTLDNIHIAFKDRMNKWLVKDETLIRMYENLELANPKAKKAICGLLLKASLFNQPYFKYDGLVKFKEYLSTEKNVEV